MTLVHQDNQVLVVDKGEVVDGGQIYPVLFFESQVLHYVHTEHIVTQLLLIYHERDVSRVLSQEDQDSVLRLLLGPEKFALTDVKVAESVERLVLVLGQLGHHQVDGPMVSCVSSCN